MYGSYFDTHFAVDPNAEYKAAYDANVCSECHSALTSTGRCPNEGGCSRWRPEVEDPEPRDTIQFDDEPPEETHCQRCQDGTPGDHHTHHQIKGRWVPCNGDESCSYCYPPKRQLTDAQRAHLQRIASLGGRARAKQFTTDSQRHAANHLTGDHHSRAGKRGAQVTLERHGAAKLVEVLTNWRKEHRSRPEQAFEDLLTANEFVLVEDSSAAHVEEFEREVPVDADGLLRLDYGSRHWRWAIEVRGGVHDVWDTPQHEAERLATIREAGWNVLVIRDSDLVNRSGKARYAFGLERMVKDHIAASIGAWFGTYREQNPVPARKPASSNVLTMVEYDPSAPDDIPF